MLWHFYLQLNMRSCVCLCVCVCVSDSCVWSLFSHFSFDNKKIIKNISFSRIMFFLFVLVWALVTKSLLIVVMFWFICSPFNSLKINVFFFWFGSSYKSNFGYCFASFHPDQAWMLNCGRSWTSSEHIL